MSNQFHWPSDFSQPDNTELHLLSFHPDLAVLASIFSDQAPPRPYAASSAIMPLSSTSNSCQHPTCPLNFPHARGLYLHMNEPSVFTAARPHFGASNPPFEIWMARDRILNGQGHESDFTDVLGFIHAHYVAWNSVEGQYASNCGPAAPLPGTREKDQDTNMMDLAGEMADVQIQDDTAAPKFEPPRQTYSPRTEALIERQFEEAFLEMELEETMEAAARMKICDEEVEKESVAAERDKNEPQPLGRPLQELIEQAHRICVEVGEEIDRDDGIF
ncbi:MAG: hypothetical protein Q9170_005351 [Blastenia crenularia]